MRQNSKFDVAVIGAGAVGCSIAMHLAKAGKSVVVLEKQAKPGTSTHSRNSGVLHSGIYFTSGFLKTQLCVEGQSQVYNWAEKNKVPYKKTGKLVVAFSEKESFQLSAILRQSKENGCKNITQISAHESAKKFSFLNSPCESLFCAETGIIDPHELTRSYWQNAVEAGAVFHFGSAINRVEILGKNCFQIRSKNERFESEILVNSAGLDAVSMVENQDFHLPKVHPCRGDFFKVFLPFPIPHLVYPIKDPHQPGLGIHLTIDLHGGLTMGPDATYLESEPLEFVEKKKNFESATRKLFKISPQLQIEHAGFGVRPKLSLRGESEKDFYIHEDAPGWWNLLGIESPGLTASFRLGEYLKNLIFH